MIKRFEDLEIWQLGKDLVKEVYELTSSGKFGKDFAFKNQIRRAAISVPSNIAEGFGRGGNKELINFLYISHGSLCETKSHLLIAKELGYLGKNNTEALFENIEKLKAKTLSLVKSLKESPYKGNKFKRTTSKGKI